MRPLLSENLKKSGEIEKLKNRKRNINEEFFCAVISKTFD
jgi:hypothetical protein